MTHRTRGIWLAAVGAFALQLASCSGTESRQAATEDTATRTGTLELPLVASFGEHTYQLTVQFYISGPTSGYYSSNDDDETMNLGLPAGNYTLYLYGWQLYRLGADGQHSPVVSSLIESPSSFTIYNNSTSTLSFRLETDGVIVSTGSGSGALTVDVEVSEIAPPCTPLGDDCEAGSWCPPGELVSHTPNCLPAGETALGQACRNPADCVANASCVELGDGPRCVALCTAGSFGESCEAGGLCTPQGLDYGICVPSSLAADGGAEFDAGSDAGD